MAAGSFSLPRSTTLCVCLYSERLTRGKQRHAPRVLEDHCVNGPRAARCGVALFKYRHQLLNTSTWALRNRLAPQLRAERGRSWWRGVKKNRFTLCWTEEATRMKNNGKAWAIQGREIVFNTCLFYVHFMATFVGVRSLIKVPWNHRDPLSLLLLQERSKQVLERGYMQHERTYYSRTSLQILPSELRQLDATLTCHLCCHCSDSDTPVQTDIVFPNFTAKMRQQFPLYVQVMICHNRKLQLLTSVFVSLCCIRKFYQTQC